MALEDFFDHKCKIYYLQESTDSPAYGLPSAPSFSYSETPDVDSQDGSGIPCHFEVKGQSLSINQGEPINILDANIKLVLPAGTLLHKNDKVVDVTPNADSYLQEYTAEVPHDIRGHHVFVYVKAKGRQKEL